LFEIIHVLAVYVVESSVSFVLKLLDQTTFVIIQYCSPFPCLLYLQRSLLYAGSGWCSAGDVFRTGVARLLLVIRHMVFLCKQKEYVHADGVVQGNQHAMV
jgi:hypothetical protein